MKIIIHFQLSSHENTGVQNSWDPAKNVRRGKVIVLTTFLGKYKGEFRDDGSSSDTVFESSWNNNNGARK